MSVRLPLFLTLVILLAGTTRELYQEPHPKDYQLTHGEWRESKVYSESIRKPIDDKEVIILRVNLLGEFADGFAVRVLGETGSLISSVEAEYFHCSDPDQVLGEGMEAGTVISYRDYSGAKANKLGANDTLSRSDYFRTNQFAIVSKPLPDVACYAMFRLPARVLGEGQVAELYYEDDLVYRTSILSLATQYFETSPHPLFERLIIPTVQPRPIHSQAEREAYIRGLRARDK